MSNINELLSQLPDDALARVKGLVQQVVNEQRTTLQEVVRTIDELQGRNTIDELQGRNSGSCIGEQTPWEERCASCRAQFQLRVLYDEVTESKGLRL